MSSVAKSLRVTSLGVVAAILSFSAQAEGNAYVEAGFAQLRWSEGSESVTPSNALMRFGYDFTQNFAAEGVASTSVSSDALMGVSFKVDNFYGVNLKGQVELVPHFEMFARAGWTHVNVSGSAGGVSASASGSSFSYGAGAQYLVTKNWYMQGDYTSYYHKSGDSISGPSISVGYRF